MKPVSLLFIVMSMLLFSACKDKNQINLLETNARDEVPLLGNFTFTFDKNLAADSQLNRWLEETPIIFKPAIPGRFKWNHPNELIFSPAGALRPATAYEATIDKKIAGNTPYKLGKNDPIRFHTPALNFTQNSGMWVSRESGTADIVPEITLRFNYSVLPKEVGHRLRVYNDKTELEARVMNEEAADYVTLRLMNVKVEDKDLNLRFVIDKGLTPIGGKTPTGEAMESTVPVASPFTLNIGETMAHHDGTRGTIKVLCSQQISSDQNLSSFVSLEPPVAFDVQTTDEGLLISSESVDVATVYSLNIKKGLKGAVGGTLKENYESSVSFGKLEPSISFADQKGVYLSSAGARNLEVKIVNVKEIKVTISKIYENNLLSARKHGFYRDYWEENYDETSPYPYAIDDYENTFGDVVYEKVIATARLPKYRNSRLFNFSFPDNLPEFKGIYHIKISSSEEYYLNDAKFVSLSDIGLIARQGEKKLYVFASGIRDAKPMANVQLTAFGLNNQKIGSAMTNGEGYAEIPLSKTGNRGFIPAMITARAGNDFNYMPMSSTRVETSRFDVGGVSQNINGLRAFIYGDRDIYRPGEQVFFSAVLRDALWKSPGNIPVKVKILLPGGQEFKVIKKALNDQGSMESSILLSSAAVSGRYNIEVYSSTDILLANRGFLVEEFVPDRIKVKTSLDKTDYKPGDMAALSLSAENYFGPPAAGRNFEVDFQLKEKEFISEKFPDYNFSLNDRNNYYESVVSEGETNEQGKAAVQLSIPAYYKDRGILQADVFTTVFDETGRPVSRAVSAPVYTQQVFYGIKGDGYGYCPLNQHMQFRLIALNKDDLPYKTARARVMVIKHDYKTVVSNYGSYFRYESQQVNKTLVDKELILEGSRSYFSYVPRSPGNYEVRISRPGSANYVSQHFYSYGWNGNFGGSFEVNREGNVDISTDKKSYETGERARILFKAPFNGRMLVTVEQNELISYHYLDVKDRAASMDLPLSTRHLPNIYITATLIKPHSQTENPLTVAHGFKSVSVEETSRKMAVTITAPEKIRSNTRQKIKVKALPGSMITLSAVDEGILQITRYATPDPYAYFYAKRALEMAAFDLYPYLLPEIKGVKSSTGGDGYDLNKRVNPMPNKRVKLVAHWSGMTDAKTGELTADLEIPQFSGEIRLMAVAYKDEKFGHAEAAMKVSDPIVISTGFPRFMSPGDTVYASVTLSNTTEKDATASLDIQTMGMVRFAGPGPGKVRITAGSEIRVPIKIVAAQNIGTASLMVKATALGDVFTEKTEFTVRPAGSLTKYSDAGTLLSGKSKTFSIGTQFLKGTEKRSLIVSRNPVLPLAEHLNYLVQYPYGCTEQVISAAFPQLYYGDLADLVKKDEHGKSFANQHVLEAIRTIKMRQLYSGGLVLWEGQGEENWWATAYGAHFLLEAEKAGFEVDQSLIKSMLTYLSGKVKQRSLVEYRYNRTENKRIAPKTVAYSLFVLAMSGNPDVSTMNYYKQHNSELALDSRYLLAAAYALSGDREKYRQILPGAFSGEIANTEGGGSYASAIRDGALALYVLVNVDPGNAQVGTMAGHLSMALKNQQNLNTQERTFALLSLGQLARKAAASNAQAEVKAGGKSLGIVKEKSLKFSHAQLKDGNIEITASGGPMYYFYFSEGIPKTVIKEADQYVKVRRTYLDRFGRTIQGNQFESNDLIVVKITLENVYDRDIEQMVITDILPAGFEIENHRVKTLPGMNWIQGESTATHTDIRDDRIHFFTDLGKGTQTYYYSVRAVTPGYFRTGPVSADAMYQGDIYSYHGAGYIRVVD